MSIVKTFNIHIGFFKMEWYLSWNGALPCHKEFLSFNSNKIKGSFPPILLIH